MSNFDEKSGVIPCETEFGRWWQTVDEVFVEFTNIESPVSSKEIKCEIKNNEIKCVVRNALLLEGKLYRTIRAEESFWTLEDKRTVKMLLAKANPDASNCWSSLFADGKYSADPWILDQMQRKLTLQRLQTENPGFDFGNAEITGNYQTGGPRLPV